MSETGTYWLHGDVPTKRSVLHAAACRHAHAKHNTQYKGIGQLKRDGGRLSVATPEEAQHFFRRSLQPNRVVSLIPCADCVG